jgi:zinc transporter ZupT
MPGVIMMAAMFVVFVIEMYLNSKTGGHSHGGPTGSNFRSTTPPVRPTRPYTEDFDFGLNNDIGMEKHVMQDTYHDEKKQAYQVENRPVSVVLDSLSQMPPWFVVFYEQYVRQREEMMSQIQSLQTRDTPPAPKYEAQPTNVSAFELSADSPYLDDNGQPVDPQLYKKLSANITLLEGGILFHSVFIGMTISITTEGFIILLIAIVFHQMFEGLGLGSRIAAVPYARNSIRPWVLVAAFGVTAPIGQAIGLLTKDTYDPNSAFGLIMVGTFNAM